MICSILSKDSRLTLENCRPDAASCRVAPVRWTDAVKRDLIWLRSGRDTP